jgi:RNA polymerase sigma-70 factor (ECF subfamily)
VRHSAISRLRAAGSRERRERGVARNRDVLFVVDPTMSLAASEAAEALTHLAAELRETLTLRIWGQLTFAEIASVTDMPVSTVHSRYHEALAVLRARLEKKPCPNL